MNTFNNNRFLTKVFGNAFIISLCAQQPAFCPTSVAHEYPLHTDDPSLNTPQETNTPQNTSVLPTETATKPALNPSETSHSKSFIPKHLKKNEVHIEILDSFTGLSKHTKCRQVTQKGDCSETSVSYSSNDLFEITGMVELEDDVTNHGETLHYCLTNTFLNSNLSQLAGTNYIFNTKDKSNFAGRSSINNIPGYNQERYNLAGYEGDIFFYFNQNQTDEETSMRFYISAPIKGKGSLAYSFQTFQPADTSKPLEATPLYYYRKIFEDTPHKEAVLETTKQVSVFLKSIIKDLVSNFTQCAFSASPPALSEINKQLGRLESTPIFPQRLP